MSHFVPTSFFFINSSCAGYTLLCS